MCETIRGFAKSWRPLESCSNRRRSSVTTLHFATSSSFSRKLRGELKYLWRAVDLDGEKIETLVQNSG